MRTDSWPVATLLVSLSVGVQLPHAQAPSPQRVASGAARLMRPVIRGQQYAVSSMKAEATEAATRVLEAGGNAFDAAVAGQAVLALVDPDSNGFGADAVVLVHVAAEKKVYSIMPARRVRGADGSSGT